MIFAYSTQEQGDSREGVFQRKIQQIGDKNERERGSSLFWINIYSDERIIKKTNNVLNHFNTEEINQK